MVSKPFIFFSFNSIFLLCLLNHLFPIPTNSISGGNETDLLSLLAIKDGIEGLSSWNLSSHFCQWHGITCGRRHQRVVELNLSSQSLVGSLSPHLGNLSFLRFVNLENNAFYGKIPEEIGGLFRLQILYVTNNSFEDKIPVNLTRCTNLRFIDLAKNTLSGSVPAQLGSLSNLVGLSLYGNRLTGEVPPSLGNLSSLQYLYLGSNRLEGSIPDTLGWLSSLTVFNVELNRLSGKVPLSLYNISSITTFAIADNQFTGSIPPDMGINLPNLVEFFPAKNQFSGPLPASLGNASKIEKIGMPENHFTGNIPTSWGVLQNVDWISLGSNYLGRGEADDSSLFTSLANCSSLNFLNLESNTLRGVIPNSVANFSNRMEGLYIGYNEISGVIPKGIGNLVNLTILGLQENNFHGSIPSSIGDMHRLQVLYLGGNKLTGSIPTSLANLTLLSDLYLQENRLKGILPSNLARCQHLQRLIVSDNNLNGTIPKEIFSIPSLSLTLDLSMNSFSGSLPVEVGNLISVGYLNISGNKLSGEIPSAFGRCLSLEYLSLSNNLFEGAIPQSLSSLKGMQSLDLSRNNLSGQIPKILGSLSNLQYLDLSFNKLEGEVPMEGIFKNSSIVSVNGNLKLCGGIREMQLPTCEIKYPPKKNKPVSFILAITISVALIFLLASSFVIFCWKKKTKLEASTESMKHLHMRVSYRDLFEATGGFSPENFLGSGGFGRVYKGILRNYQGRTVAVKVFNLNQKGASKVFMAECESLRTIRHFNLVKILTSCCSTDSEGNDFKALVFEYMENGSLERWLHQDSDGNGAPSRNLDLSQRLDIAIDIASGLTYLHHDCHISVVHRDLKPSNVLLDSDMVARVSDFGLAKLLSKSEESLSMNQSTSIFVKGTIGYVAPEYGMGSVASIHADVYSYGVLLLELFTRRRPTDEMFIDGLNLHKYVRDSFPDRYIEIMDPVLLTVEDETIGDVDRNIGGSRGRNKWLDCVYEVMKIGVACSVESPTERMDIRDVSRKLLMIKDSFLDIRMHGEIKPPQNS